MQKAYDTRGSQDVSDPSTSRAQRCLTCQIGRDGVFSTRYGRKRLEWGINMLCFTQSHSRALLFHKRAASFLASPLSLDSDAMLFAPFLRFVRQTLALSCNSHSVTILLHQIFGECKLPHRFSAFWLRSKC